MSNARVLIVGGNSGIGKEIANQLTDNDPWLEGSAIETPSQGELDITDERGIEKYLMSGPPFSHIVYSAGVNELEWGSQLKMYDFVEQYKINVFGFALLLGAHRRIFPHIDFSSVAIVSDAMRNAMRGSTVYCSSKAALAAVIRNLAREWAPGCRVNGVSPAIVHDTPMTNVIDHLVPSFRGWTEEQAQKYERSLLPMKRRVQKAEVAQVVLDVLFGPAYLTGSIIDITGGK